MEHPPKETLERFIEGRASRRESRQIVAHLLHGCGSCAALAVSVFSPTVSDRAYAEVFDRVERGFVARFGAAHLPALQGTSTSLW